MDGYYGGEKMVESSLGQVCVDSPRPILAKLKMQRERILESLKTLDNAIAMLEQHPEFAEFTDIMNKVGRL
jgi:hypothetical protein